MSKQIIHEEYFDAYTAGGSLFLILDPTARKLLSQELGENFDKDKHQILRRIELSKDNKIYCTYWFVKRNEKK